jgi:mannose/fructose/N-acetylgalactosamine-specific phosphotransferase system component IIC
MKNNRSQGAFYIAFGWVLGCYSSVALYFFYKELGLYILCILGTLGLLASVLYYHNKQHIYSANEPEKTKKSVKLKDRISSEDKS